MNLFRRLHALFRKKKLDREMAEEMRFHLTERAEDEAADGLPRDEADYAARRKFGNVGVIQEHARDQRGWAWLDHLLQDLRYAARQLRKAPGFAATAILTVALGIGSCAALFSIVNGVLLRPLRFADPERIVTLTETRPPSSQRVGAAPAAYLDWVAQTSSFTQLAANAGRGYYTRVEGRVVNVSGGAITANFLPMLQVEPLRGRNFLPEEEVPGKDHVVILSYGTWQSAFGGRESALGETVLLNDQAYTIVGILPDRRMLFASSVYTPLTFSNAARSDYGSHGGMGVTGRLKPGVSLEQAQRDLDLVSEHIGAAHPDSNKGHGAYVEPLLDALTGDVRLQLLVLLSAVGFLLLIACVNVASLLLARANARQKEIAVRAALGASRSRIVRQFLVESLLVSAAGGALGTLIAYGSMGGLRQFVGSYVPRTEEIVLDGSVLAVAIGLVLLAGLGVGLLPALQFTRGDLVEPLKEAGRGSSLGRKRQRLRSLLVVVEIALAMMLLAGTGLLARSLAALRQADQGFKTQDVYVSGIGLGGKRYSSDEQVVTFVRDAVERISAVPEVEAAAGSVGLPMRGTMGLLFTVEGMPAVPVKDMFHTVDLAVTPDYFKALEIPLLRGRGFTAQDRAGAPRVIVINQELARRHFPGVDPIGRRLMIMTMADTPDVFREIVGVVGDVRSDGPQSSISPQVYEPFAQRPQGYWQLIVKAKGPAPAMPAAVAEVLHTLEPDLPFRNLRRYDNDIANSWSRQRFSMILFIAFSVIALLLAAIGIYGVMAYAVHQRTQEIGIRMALGAKVRDVLGLVLGGAARMVGLGLLLGLAGALTFARLLQTLLFQTSPADPVTLLAVAAVLALVALLASWLPARRATKIDPMVALRAE